MAEIRGVLADLLGAARAIARADIGAGGGPPRVLSLRDAIIREYVEDAGEYSVKLEEASRRLLRPLLARSVSRWARRQRVVEVGVDSSSRSLETSVGALIVAGGAASAPGRYPLVEWPSLDGPARAGPGFLGVVGVRAPERWPLVTSSPAGHSYEEYSLEQAMDEMRVGLENWLLAGPALEWVRAARERGLTPIVLVDGPVVPVTMAFRASAWSVGDRRYVEAWRRLVEDRLRAVSALERAGAAVVGVVKRLGRSTIISKLRASFPGLEGAGGEVSDYRALYYCYQRVASPSPGRVYASPRMKVMIFGAGEPIVKNVEYVVIPPGRWARSPWAARYYRVEYTDRTLAILEGLGARGVYPVVHDSVLRGSLEPVEIAASDRRSRHLTRSLRSLLAGILVREGVPLEYRAVVEAHA